MESKQNVDNQFAESKKVTYWSPNTKKIMGVQDIIETKAWVKTESWSQRKEYHGVKKTSKTPKNKTKQPTKPTTVESKTTLIYPTNKTSVREKTRTKRKSENESEIPCAHRENIKE